MQFRGVQSNAGPTTHSCIITAPVAAIALPSHAAIQMTLRLRGSPGPPNGAGAGASLTRRYLM